MSYDRLLKTNEDYEKALSRIDELFDSEPGTPKANGTPCCPCRAL